MTTLDQIEAAILQLPSDDIQRLSAWLQELEHARWDQQLEKDVADGKLDKFAEQAIRDFRAGRARKV